MYVSDRLKSQREKERNIGGDSAICNIQNTAPTPCSCWIMLRRIADAIDLSTCDKDMGVGHRRPGRNPCAGPNVFLRGARVVSRTA